MTLWRALQTTNATDSPSFTNPNAGRWSVTNNLTIVSKIFSPDRVSWAHEMTVRIVPFSTNHLHLHTPFGKPRMEQGWKLLHSTQVGGADSSELDFIPGEWYKNKERVANIPETHNTRKKEKRNNEQMAEHELGKACFSKCQQ